MFRGFKTVIVACLFTLTRLPVAADTDGKEIIPLIIMKEVPLRNALSILALRAGLNCIIDPNIGREAYDLDGSPFAAATVNAQWDNLTARQALEKLLNQQGLALVENTSASISRIVPTNQPQKSVSTGRTPANERLIEEIKLDDVPLEDAIKRLAADAHLNIILDPRLSDPTYGTPGRFLTKWPISIHWKNVTASQALTALLENYGLQLEDSPGVFGRVTVTTPMSPQQFAPKPGK